MFDDRVGVVGDTGVGVDIDIDIYMYGDIAIDIDGCLMTEWGLRFSSWWDVGNVYIGVWCGYRCSC